MFEEESKEYANKWLYHVKDLELHHKENDKPEYIRILEAHQKGAEFGYNKANEWHYCKDKKMPKFDEGTEIKFLKGKYTKAKRIVFCLCENNDYQDIYAWKEIVLPELKDDE